VGELDDSFTQLLGRQPSDREKQDLYRVRDALKLKPTDAVWMLLMALQHYQTLYEQIPARIVSTAREVTKAVRAAAEAEAKAAQEETKRALMDAVRHAAVRSAEQAAGAQREKWVASQPPCSVSGSS
jgi:antitoxin component of RelBE/YafQ-DinJ toxin-antitoxin module